MKTDTKKLTCVSLICALSYILMLLSKFIPEVAGFLQFDLKDVMIVTGAFILGPWCAVLVGIIVPVIELLTASNTGLIGMLMNIVSTISYTFPPAFVYSRCRSYKGAVGGLSLGTAVLVVMMLLWNYYITPIYMKIPREVVADMLPTVFLPFNLLKGLINSGVTLILYKPLVTALSRTGLIKSQTAAKKSGFLSPALIMGIVLLALCIPQLLYMMGII